MRSSNSKLFWILKTRFCQWKKGKDGWMNPEKKTVPISLHQFQSKNEALNVNDHEIDLKLPSSPAPRDSQPRFPIV